MNLAYYATTEDHIDPRYLPKLFTPSRHYRKLTKQQKREILQRRQARRQALITTK